jgi:hypothetical protein
MESVQCKNCVFTYFSKGNRILLQKKPEANGVGLLSKIKRQKTGRFLSSDTGMCLQRLSFTQ